MQLVVLVGFGWTSWVWLGIIFKFESLNRGWYTWGAGGFSHGTHDILPHVS